MKHVFVNFCLLQKHKCQCSVFRSHQVTILHFPLISKVSSSHLWTQHLANYQIYILMSGHTGIFISPHTDIFPHYSPAPGLFLLRLIQSWKLFNDCSPCTEPHTPDGGAVTIMSANRVRERRGEVQEVFSPCQHSRWCHWITLIPCAKEF